VVFEPTIIISSEKEQRAITATLNSFYKVPPIQPNVHTVTVSLSNTEALFNNLKQRTRRAIRQAEKAKVRVEKAVYTEKTKDTFFLMYKETAKRAGFFIRSKEYYVSFWDSYHKNGQGEFFFAYRGDEEDPIAGVFIVYDEKKALYKDGASVRTGLPSGTLHLLQWEVMKWLESKKVQTYDLHGVPPSWQQDDKNHRQYGLGIFKTSFGETTDYIGALQHDIKPVHAKLWHKVFKKLYFTLASKRGGFFY
jgi:serine/alanine adding enzyme